MREAVDARKVARLNIVGVPLDNFEKLSLLNFISTCVENQRLSVVGHINLHSICCLFESPEMKDLLNLEEAVVHIDGMPIVWAMKMKGCKVKRDNRLTYLDWGEDLLAIADQKGWKVGYVGSSSATCLRAVEFFKRRHPSLQIRGWSGYFDLHDDAVGSQLRLILGEIREYAPQLLFVGMGQPRQEIFVKRHFRNMGSTVYLCCGAFFEYFVSDRAPPPRWMGRLGLEWLYRLAQNPRRYSYRYLVEPFKVLRLLLRARDFR